MKSFLVTVHPARVEIREFTPVSSTRIPEQIASVDGERYQYFVDKDKDTESKSWRGMANNALFYHAKNSGSYVFFIAVNKVRSRKKEDVSDNQIKMF